MRKLVFVLAMLFLGSVVYSQNVDLRVSKLKSSLDATLDISKDETFYFAYPTATYDTVSNVWDVIIGVDNVFDLTKQYCSFKLDSVAGTPVVTVRTFGKLFWNDSWTGIDSVSWAGTTADTTFATSNSAAAYRFYKLSATADTAGNFKWKVGRVEMKLFK